MGSEGEAGFGGYTHSAAMKRSLIAAHALARDLIVVTNNVGEFERVPDLRIENWAE